MPFTYQSFKSVLNSAKISGHLLLHDSQEPQLKIGSWHVEEPEATAESDVKNKLISGHHQFQYKGLGYSPGPKIPFNKSFQIITKILMTPVPSLKQCSCKFKINGLSG